MRGSAGYGGCPQRSLKEFGAVGIMPAAPIAFGEPSPRVPHARFDGGGRLEPDRADIAYRPVRFHLCAIDRGLSYVLTLNR